MIRKEIKYGICMILFMLVVDFGAGYYYVKRHNAPKNIRTFHPYYHHGLKENSQAVSLFTTTQKYELYTNSLGFRDKTVRHVPLRSDRQRIVFIGDSFTEGVGVSYDATFVGIVEKSLDPAYEVFNAGVISYSAMTNYLKIQYLIEQVGLKFDELYVFSDISDVYNDYSLEILENFTPRLKLPYFGELFMKAHRFMDGHSYFCNRVQIIYNYVKLRKYERGFPWWTIKDEVYDAWANRGIEISGKYMQMLVDLCRKNNIRVTIVVYPWTNLIEERDLNSRQVKFWSDFAERNNTGFINLFPLFINDMPVKEVLGNYFIDDDIHWSEKGHELVASVVLNDRYLRKPDPSDKKIPNRTQNGN